MADETTPETGEETTAPEETAAPEGDGDLPEGAKRALQAARKEARDAEKRAKAAEQKAREYEDAKKTDLERLQEERDRLKADVAPLQTQLLQYQAAAAVGLDISLADRVRGDDLAAMKKDAEALKGRLGAPPATSFDNGARTTSTPPSFDDLIRQRAGV